MRFMLKVFFLALLLLGNLVPSSPPLSAEENKTVVYFYHSQCTGCAEIEDEGALSTLEDEGIEVIRYNTGENIGATRFIAYNETYGVEENHRYAPIIFAGDNYFYGPSNIIDAVDDGELQDKANEPLLDVSEHEGTVVYFYHPQCSGCDIVEDEKIDSKLIDSGVEVIRYNTGDEDDAKRFLAYNETYDVKNEHRYTPIMFVGDTYYYGHDTIIEAFESGTLQDKAGEPLMDVPDEIIALEGWGGLGRVIVAGLLDGINPCAIAMLLMFISIIGFLKHKRTLIIVSTSYILGIFLTYFAIGLGLFWVMTEFQTTLDRFAHILYFVFGLLALTLFALTFRDFLVTQKEEYGKVVNQLPGRLKRWNQKVMARFSDVIKNEDNRGIRALYIGVIPFIIGIVIGITEAACTGQIYIMILLSIRTTEPVTGTFYLLVFNLLFILPLIIIAIIAVMTRNVMGVSNFFREKMPLIKLLTSIFFILMALYFILLAFDIRLFNLISWVI